MQFLFCATSQGAGYSYYFNNSGTPTNPTGLFLSSTWTYKYGSVLSSGATLTYNNSVHVALVLIPTSATNVTATLYINNVVSCNDYSFATPASTNTYLGFNGVGTIKNFAII